MLAVCCTLAWAQALVVRDVSPAGGPYFERLQQRLDDDVDVQLNFEVDLGSLSPVAVRIEGVTMSYYDGDALVGGPTSLGIDALRARWLQFGDRDGYGAALDGHTEHDRVPSTTEGLNDGIVLDTWLYGAGFERVFGRDVFLGTAQGDVGGLAWVTSVHFNTLSALATSITASTAGDLVLAGVATESSGVQRFAVARLDTSGKMVNTFDLDGRLTTVFPGCNARAEDVEELTDNRTNQRMIVAIGQATCAATEVALAAYTDTGAPAPGFLGTVNAGPGTARVTLVAAGEVGGGAVDDRTDRIWVVGQLAGKLLVQRYTTAGKLDPTWAGGFGSMVYNLPVPHTDVKGWDAQPTPDGGLVIAADGLAATGYEMLAIRILADGGLDPKFNRNGISVVGWPGYDHAFCRDIELATDGSVHLSGWVEHERDVPFAVASIAADGLLVPTFGEAGRVRVTFDGDGPNARSYGMDIDDEGFLQLAGVADAHLASARLRALDGSPDDPTVLSPDSMRLLVWPDTNAPNDDLEPGPTAFAWGSLPDRIRLAIDVADPFTHAPLDALVEDLVPTRWTAVDPHLYSFPADKADLPDGHYWKVEAAHSLDEAHRTAGFQDDALDPVTWPERFGWDLVVVRRAGDGWTKLHAGESGTSNDDKLVWRLPVHAIGPGEVVRCVNGVATNTSGTVDGDCEGCFWHPYGNSVTIRHDDGSESTYSHLQTLDPSICPVGSGSHVFDPATEELPSVGVDSPIGAVGNSGQSTGPHLHLHVRRDGDGIPLYFEDVYGISDSQGPDAFPYPVLRGSYAQHIGSVLKIGIAEPGPPPVTTCEGVNGLDEQDDASHPDGDFGIGWYCPDHDGESVCVDAGDGSGHCEPCDGEEPFRPVGCACTTHDDCETGLTCWGKEIGAVGDPETGNAEGRCYSATEGPPSWQCTFTCSELLGEGAWCWNDHPATATCYDAVTTSGDAALCTDHGDNGAGTDACFDACGADPLCSELCDIGEALYASYGECVVQCVDDSDCADALYPAGLYVCGLPWGHPECIHVSRAH